jgi:hypothetical protein
MDRPHLFSFRSHDTCVARRDSVPLPGHNRQAKIDRNQKLPQSSDAVQGIGGNMAEVSGADVSRYDFAVAYDGKGRADNHSIAVEDLAPALMAFGRLIREANAEFNGKKATAKVVVVSDFESKCFQINFEVIVSLFQHVKMLIDSQTASDAKTVLEWLGLIEATAGGAVVAGIKFIEYLKLKAGRKAELITSERDTSGSVEVHIQGEKNNVVINKNVFNLSLNTKALTATRDALLPLGHDGFDVMRVGRNRLAPTDPPMLVIDGEDVQKIVASCTLGIEEAKETEPNVEVTPAWLSVYSPVFDEDAPTWRFKLGTDVIYADISETQIAHEAMQRGGSFAEDAYQVRLEITTPVDAKGKDKSPSYKILSVTRFVPATPTNQGSLFGPT